MIRIHPRLIFSGILFLLAAWIYSTPGFILFPRPHASSSPNSPSAPSGSSSTSGPAVPSPSSGSRHNQWTIEAATSAFLTYAHISSKELQKMRKSYKEGSTGTQKFIGSEIGYPRKLDQWARIESLNGEITRSIAELAIESRGLDRTVVEARTEGSVFRVREALQHIARDWSEEGLKERSSTIGPILEYLKGDISIEVEGESQRRGKGRVLVPGAGAGRLAWDISELGYNTTANELSPYMNLAFRYLLETKSAFTIYPWAHRFSNQRTPNAQFRPISVPDTFPRISETFHWIEGDFLSLPSPKFGQGDEARYDYIITQFFIDASTNVLSIIEQIYKLLVPGGKWINLGPLLWAGGGVVTLELSLEEVLVAAQLVGFEVVDETLKTVECEYTADQGSMLRRVYGAEFWVARKV